MSYSVDADSIKHLYDADRLMAVIDALWSTEIVTSDLRLSFMLGDSLRQIGRQSDAIPHLERALDADKTTRFNATTSLALLYKDSGRYQAAEALLDDFASHSVSLPGWFWVIRGSIAANLQEFSRAIEFFQRAELSDNVDLDEVWLNMAYQYRALGDLEQSAKHAQQVIDIDGNLAGKAKEVLHSLWSDTTI